MAMFRIPAMSLLFAALVMPPGIAAADPLTLLCRYIETDMLNGSKQNAELYVTLDLKLQKYMFAHTMEVSDMKGVSESQAVLVGQTDDSVDGEAIIVSIGRQDGKYTSVLKTDGVHLVSSGKCVPSELIPFPAQGEQKKLF